MKTEISEQENQAHIDHHRRLLRAELAKEKPNETDVIHLGYTIQSLMFRKDGCESVVMRIGEYEELKKGK